MEKILEKVYRKVISYLREGYNVITETAWVTKEDRDKAREIPAKEGFQTKVIFIDVSEVQARNRLQKNRKTKKRFDITDKIFNEAIKDFEKPQAKEDILYYDSSIPIDLWIKQNLI